MGILNVTVDSFSDGGKYLSPGAAVDRALQMVEEGADIIDVGGESTRPGAEPVSAGVEMERVIPVIRRIARETDALISVDTSKASVAAAALEAGASIINDVCGARDTRMFEVARASGAGIILMHMQGTPRTMQTNPRYDDVVAEVGEFFRQSLARALEYRIDARCIAFDPGIGFGKTVAHNLQLLGDMESLASFGRPLVIGVSRKSFIGRLLNDDAMERRLWPTVALTSLLREKGARIFRVHDVRENRDALRMTEAVLSGGVG